MWGPLARWLDIGVAFVAARRYGRFFGETPPSDFTRSLHDMLRSRLKYEARFVEGTEDLSAPVTVDRGRRTLPSRVHRLRIDRGGEVVETSFSHFARGHAGRLLIVYHHGLGEIPNEMSFRKLFLSRRGATIPADLVCYHATGHRSPREVGPMLSTLGGFGTLLGDSLLAVRAIGRAYRQRYDRVVYVGASLGGMVGIIESALSCSYDLNVSLVAHLDLVHCITETGFRRMIDPRFLATAPMDLMRIGTDADRFMAAAQRRLVMINGIHDEYFRIDLAREVWSRFGGIRHYEIPHGHISAMGATRCLRETLLQALRDARVTAR
ncbi:MAG: hypothetical protein JXQ73_13100 [Phycisphaerae bacterium]|nr:hypothetical protein [Phycisphaerae bacterium]